MSSSVTRHIQTETCFSILHRISLTFTYSRHTLLRLSRLNVCLTHLNQLIDWLTCWSSSRHSGAAGSGTTSKPNGLQLQRLGPAWLPLWPAASAESAGVPAPAQQVLHSTTAASTTTTCLLRAAVLNNKYFKYSALDSPASSPPLRVFFLELTDDVCLERISLRATDPVSGERSVPPV